MGLLLPSPSPHLLHLLHFLLLFLLFLLTHIKGRLRPRTLVGMGGDGLQHRVHVLGMKLDQKSSNPWIYL